MRLPQTSSVLVKASYRNTLDQGSTHNWQACDPVLHEPGSPPAHRVRCRAELGCNVLVGCTRRAGQNCGSTAPTPAAF
jgi:hypothetical protein